MIITSADHDLLYDIKKTIEDRQIVRNIERKGGRLIIHYHDPVMDTRWTEEIKI